MQEIARKLFVSLNKDTFYKNRYYVLNDQNYVTDFYSETEEKAVEKFNATNWSQFIAEQKAAF